jgi:LPXTG-motif cell wall-anchored protein
MSDYVLPQWMQNSQIKVIPVGQDSLVVCHWQEESGSWAALTVPHQALNGHGNHELDIWPPVQEVTPGMNWPAGQEVYLNDCALPSSPSPTSSTSASASPSPTDTLPPTGAAENAVMAVLGVALIAAGAWMKAKSL